MKNVISSKFFFSLCFLFISSYTYSQIVINKYAAILDFQPCNNILIVDSTTGFNVGDTVLMIQMKGATIDTTNSQSFGNVLDYNGCGNYEYNVIKAIAGNNITLKYMIVREYNIPNGKVQIVKVPGFQNYTINQVHTCMPWNGIKGGVFAINVVNTLTLNDAINVTGKGFRGGTNNQNPTTVGPILCSQLDFFMPPNFDLGSMKGEGIAEVSLDKSYGRGCLGNGGGGGNAHNSGGGGGSNTNLGGIGGSEYYGCNSNSSSNITGGIGGRQLFSTNAVNKIYLGGGGGSAQTNNLTISNGGAGGGICIITAGTLSGNNKYIEANGQDGLQCINNGSFGSCHDGMAGGGGAGTILLNTNAFSGNLNFEAKGGRGADETANAQYYQVGPGGGGSGGRIWFKISAIPVNVTNNVSGGANGIVVFNNTNWGALPGQPGQLQTNLQLNFPVDTFTNSTVSTEFDYNKISCFTIEFNDQTTIASGNIISWLWNFGDGTISTLQNPVHVFSNYGTYTITLTVTNNNGCIGTITKSINIPFQHFANVSGDTSICENLPIQLNASGGIFYSWQPTFGLNNSLISNPIATLNNSVTYFVNVTDSFGCTDKDSVVITIIPAETPIITPDSAKICGNGSVQLGVTGIINPQWFPSGFLSDNMSLNPLAMPLETTTYFVTGTDENGCVGKDSIVVYVYALPDINLIADNDTVNCTSPFVQLHASGGIYYSWSPPNLFNNFSISNPILTIKEPTAFYVIGTDINGCENTDSVIINISNNKNLFVPNAFSPNGDGVNDEFLPKYNCDLENILFSVYNRFGQRVFSTNNKFSGWPGLQNGEYADAGTYFWIITGNDNAGKIIRKGDVTLIR